MDTSALFAAIFSATGGARALLQLGEAGALDLLVSLDVMDELEGNLRTKALQHLATLAVVLALSNVAIVEPPDIVSVQQCQRWLQYAEDAVVLGAALVAKADYFVTLDRQHFLQNEALTTILRSLVGTPGDCLVWYRQHPSVSEQS